MGFHYLQDYTKYIPSSVPVFVKETKERNPSEVKLVKRVNLSETDETEYAIARYFFSSDKLQWEMSSLMFYKNGDIHRVGGPASILLNEYPEVSSGISKLKSIEDRVAVVLRWCEFNETHRVDGPAEIHYRTDMSVIKEKFYLNGESVNVDNGPTHIAYSIEGRVLKEVWDSGDFNSFPYMEPDHVEYYDNSKNTTKEEFWGNRQWPSMPDSMPDYVYYSKDGRTIKEQWYRKTFLHEKFASVYTINYHPNGNISSVEIPSSEVSTSPSIVKYWQCGCLKELTYTPGGPVISTIESYGLLNKEQTVSFTKDMIKCDHG